MNDILSVLSTIDRLCDQLATAIAHSGPQLFATFLFILFLSVLLFPPMDDPDQV